MANTQMTLTKAITYLISTSLDMGDSLTTEVDYLAQLCEMDYAPAIDDADDILNAALTRLIAMRSAGLCEYLEYYFTDDYSVDTIFDDIVNTWETLDESKMYNAVNTIYRNIDKFPGGRVVRRAIEDNILVPLSTHSINATRVGSQIGSIYWQYVNRPEYGGISNSGNATGTRNTTPPYAYQFSKYISSYYFHDEVSDIHCPWSVGFTCMFKDIGRDVVADIFVFVQENADTIIISDLPVHSITISDFDDAAVENVARQIANWFNTHVDMAISFGINP